MSNDDYQKVVRKYLPKESRLRNYIIAFLCGGLFGVVGETLSEFLVYFFDISKIESYGYTSIIIIGLTALLTGIGFFDDFVEKCKCGLIIPTTGFAHSVTSAALEYRKDGFITGLGSNLFKLAGSVILYGIISSFLLCLIKVVFVYA